MNSALDTPSQRKPKIGFIGQGWIGKNYADNFQARGFSVVRYDITPEFAGNKAMIADCDIVFIAVPAPTRVKAGGFDDSIIRAVLPLVGRDKVAVIKSTVPPDLPERLQKDFPDVYVIHSPEFLRHDHAREDVDNPDRNIVGYTDKSRAEADLVMSVLPYVPGRTQNIICPAREAAMIKYGGNCFLFLKLVYMNAVYDLCQAQGIDFETVKNAMQLDPRIGSSHMDVVHSGGRGAGGLCFVKDFATFVDICEKHLNNSNHAAACSNMFKQAANYNLSLLKSSQKSEEIIDEVYGE